MLTEQALFILKPVKHKPNPQPIVKISLVMSITELIVYTMLKQILTSNPNPNLNLSIALVARPDR